MSTDTLFSFLVRRFREHEEVLATAGLGYILESQACRASLHGVVERCGVRVSERLSYHTQVSADDAAIPDLVGSEPGGPPEVIIEGKFWAGLTDHQPGTYLQRLTVGQPGVLLFVTPFQRIEILWPKVLERCPPSMQAIGREVVREDELRSVRLASGHVLAMCSWRFLLNDLAQAAKIAGQDRLVADVSQLNALCEAQDRQAFLPLRLEEITDQRTAQRFVDYYGLPNAITKQARRDGVVTTAGLTAARSEYRFGHYLQLRNWSACLVIDPLLWARHGQGPLWLDINGYAVYQPDGKRVWKPVLDWAPVLSRLKVLRASSAPGPIVVELAESRPLIGLHLPTLVEREDVIKDVVEQLRIISDILGDEAPLVAVAMEAAPPSLFGMEAEDGRT